MVAPNEVPGVSKKRKNVKDSGVPSSKRRAVGGDTDRSAKVQHLEEQISASRKYYNNIATLISMLWVGYSEPKEPDLTVALSLCRVFCRLIASGNLADSNRAAENEKIIVAWLKERYQEYQKALLLILRKSDPSSQV